MQQLHRKSSGYVTRVKPDRFAQTKRRAATCAAPSGDSNDVVTNKISVYGDSTAISQLGSQTRAQRIAAYSAKFNGYNDYAVGGTSFASMFLGQDGLGNPLPGWNNRNFQQQIAVDDCDICIFNLGGYDKANGVSGTLLQANAVPEDYVGSDGLTIASNALQMIQFAVAAGLRMLVCGVPFFDAAQSVA